MSGSKGLCFLVGSSGSGALHEGDRPTPIEQGDHSLLREEGSRSGRALHRVPFG